MENSSFNLFRDESASADITIKSSLDLFFFLSSFADFARTLP
jgi:hypothetical protein